VVASSKPVTAPVAVPATPTANAPLRTFEEVLALLPIGMKVTERGKLTVVGREEATRALDNSASGRTAIFRVTVDQTRAHPAGGYEFMVSTPPTPYRLQGANILGRIEAKFRSSQAAQRPRATKGALIGIRGLIGKVAVTGPDLTPVLVITVEEAQME
jgi:hypothetical protein